MCWLLSNIFNVFLVIQLLVWEFFNHRSLLFHCQSLVRPFPQCDFSIWPATAAELKLMNIVPASFHHRLISSITNFWNHYWNNFLIVRLFCAGCYWVLFFHDCPMWIEIELKLNWNWWRLCHPAFITYCFWQLPTFETILEMWPDFIIVYILFIWTDFPA